MKKQKEHALPQRHNLVSHFLIRLLRLRILVALRRINLSKKGRLLLLFKTTSKKRQKADVEDRGIIADAPRANHAHPGYPIQGCPTPGVNKSNLSSRISEALLLISWRLTRGRKNIYIYTAIVAIKYL